MAELSGLADEVVRALGQQAGYAALLLVAAAVVELVARGRWLRLRYALWSLVVLRLVLPPDLASPLSLRGLLEASGASRWLLVLLHKGGGEGSVATVGTSAASGGPAAASWPLIVFVAWLAGVAATLVLILRWRRHTGRVMAASRPVRSLRCLAAATRWRSRLGIRRPVRLLASRSCGSPFTVGTLRPAVVLPEAVAEAWPEELLEPVLGHELAHVARWDDLWVLGLNLAQILFFFHPAVWVAARRLATVREALCDELVVTRGKVAPRQYCRSLVEQARWQVFGTRPDSILSLADTGDDVRARVKRLLQEEAAPPGRPWRAWLVAALAAVLLLPMARVRPATAERGAAPLGVAPAAAPARLPVPF